MNIDFLIAEPNTSLSALEQQDLILYQMSVFRYGGSRCKFFRTHHEMLRAVVFRTDLWHELRRSRDTGVCVNARVRSSPSFFSNTSGLTLGPELGHRWIDWIERSRCRVQALLRPPLKPHARLFLTSYVTSARSLRSDSPTALWTQNA